MKDYDNWSDIYINGDRYVYDSDGNLIAIERDEGITEYPVCDEEL